MENKTRFVNYILTMTGIMKKLLPDMDENDLKQRIKDISKENLVFNTATLTNDNYEDESNVYSIDKFITENKPIMNGYGTLFKRHDEEKNILADMCEEFGTKRKEYKNKMFEHINDEDKTEFENFNLLQKNVKVLNNSFYGVTSQGQSIFYNPIFGPSVTYQGEDIITTAVMAFEGFLSNNIDFDNVSDVINYCNNILNEEYDELNIEITNDVTYDELIEYFSNKVVNKEDLSANIDILETFLRNIPEDEYATIYFKNNLMEFFNRSDIVDTYFSRIVGRNDFLDPNEPPEDISEILKEIWNILKFCVFYNYQNFHRINRVNNIKRKSVLVVDTDSNFLYIDPYYQYFKQRFPDKIGDDDISKTSTVNIITSQLTNVIADVYAKYTKECGIPENFRPKINMKNEFLIKRIMLTENKKNYASIVLMQEGRMYSNPKLDIKGLPIRKVSVNKNVRNYYSELLENDILKDNEIDLSKIIGKYKSLESTIRDSLKRGEMLYSSPGVVNNILSYKDPFSIMTVKASYVWNALFPSDEITLNGKTNINVLKLNITSYDSLMKKLEEMNLNTPEIVSGFNEIFSNERIVKDGINAIALPQTIKTIPELIRPFIDYDVMVNDAINSGIIMLKSLGFKELNIKSKQFPSNIISL